MNTFDDLGHIVLAYLGLRVAGLVYYNAVAWILS